MVEGGRARSLGERSRRRASNPRRLPKFPIRNFQFSILNRRYHWPSLFLFM